MSLLHFLAFFVLSLHGSLAKHYTWDVRYYDQNLDHFNFQNNETYKQKYLISNEFWSPENGVIFFYAGNEAPVESFANNTGFMWELAPEFSALVIFAEHRYYGDSVPGGNASSTEYYAYLSTIQVLADFAMLLTEIRNTVRGAYEAPVIAFGGSYGGMLAAWMRMKYPNIIEGAVASSAPMMQFAGRANLCGSYAKIATQDFLRESPECVKSIRKSWDVIGKLNTTDGLQYLSKTFKLCEPLNTTDDLSAFKGSLADIYDAVAMVNYPQPATFISALPGWPIKEMCKYLNSSEMDDHQLLNAIFNAASVFKNYTGSSKCFELADTYGDVDMVAWEYQECTELVGPTCTNGVDDMFEPSPWNLEEYIQNCNDTYQVIPDLSFVDVTYGGDLTDAATNIIYSNGELDPWSGGGVTKAASDSVVLINIEDAAHHLDLRASQPGDPPSVVEARKKEKEIIRKWVAGYKQKH